MTTTPAAAMRFSVEPLGPCRKRIKVTIPPELVTEEFDKSYRQWTRSVPIPGFRPGKAPRKLVEKRFGKQVAVEVKQSLLDSAFNEAIKENKLSPIADPEVDLENVSVEPSQAVDFDITVTVKPEFDLPSFHDIEVSVPSAAPTDEEVDGAVHALRKRKAALRPVKKGGVENGDVVTIKVKGTAGDKDAFQHDGLPYEVGSRMLADLVTEGLDEALTGKEVGDLVTAKAFVPPHVESHPLAGVDLALAAEIVDLKRPELPQVDDKLAEAYDFKTKDEFLSFVREDVARHKAAQRDKLVEDLALAQLLEKTPIELPDDMIKREGDEIARRMAYELQLEGKPEEEIAKQVAEVRARRSEESANELKMWFLLDKLVEKEKILVPENEVREAVAQIAAYQGQSPEQMYVLLRDSGRLSSLRNHLKVKKARARLRSQVKVTETAGEAPAKAAAPGKPTKKKGEHAAEEAEAPKKKATKKKADKDK
ncbi:MAG TPA: trigger factor [Planctomycetota bacterium]|nr:trigger factor [Planctomycetota bacterium]